MPLIQQVGRMRMIRRVPKEQELEFLPITTTELLELLEGPSVKSQKVGSILVAKEDGHYDHPS